MRSIAMSLCLSAVTALRVTSSAPLTPHVSTIDNVLKLRGGVSTIDNVLKLRGGGDLGPVIVGASGLIGSATGMSMYLGTETVTKFLWLGLNKFPHDKYIALAMIGWAMGKFAAVKQGGDAVKSFAQLNCIPLVLWLVTNFRGGAALTTSLMPAALLAGYIYTGFIED